MDDPGTAALVMASTMMAVIAKRKRERPMVEKPRAVDTNAISLEEQAEMERAPRAFRRRQMKALAKTLSRHEP